jgi:predicted nucleic acid-binding protein
MCRWNFLQSKTNSHLPISMPDFLLDTNVVSELRRGAKCDAGVAAWQANQALDSCHLSVVSLMEIRLGIELARRRDPQQATVLQRWYHSKVRAAFSSRTLTVTAEIAEKCAELHALRPRPFRDSLILATALVHNLVVVTRNTKDFIDSPAHVLNPWTPE